MSTPTRLQQTPSQTVGPFFAYGLTPTQYGYDLKSLFTPVMARPQARGQHIIVTGQVIDGAGNPVADAMVEFNQPGSDGKFVRTVAEAEKSGFSGFGRCGTGTFDQHHYLFETVKPGAPAPGQAPFIDVCVTMRGLLVHTFTRLYFEDEADANAADAVLASVPAHRRATLVATRQADGPRPVYRFDIRMQDSSAGPETVFFDL